MATKAHQKKRAEFEIFQTGGADETIQKAKEHFMEMHPNRNVRNVEIVYACPGDRAGRWVGICIEYDEAKWFQGCMDVDPFIDVAKWFHGSE